MPQKAYEVSFMPRGWKMRFWSKYYQKAAAGLGDLVKKTNIKLMI
jgi:hypothetical protein